MGDVVCVKTKTRTDLLGVGSVGGEAPGLLHLLLAHWVPAVVVPPHDLRVVQRLDDDLILPRLAESTGPGKGSEKSHTAVKRAKGRQGRA